MGYLGKDKYINTINSLKNMEAEKGGLEKLVGGVILSVAVIFSPNLPRCSAATVPLKNTPLYKYLTTPKTNSITHQEKPLESETQNKIIEEQPQEKTGVPSNETYKQTNELINNRRQDYNRAYEQRRRVRNLADPSTFTSDMPFSEAIDILRNSTYPRLKITVLWKDLEENADIYRYTPIGIDGVSGVPLRAHLELLLNGVSAGAAEKLEYVVNGGVIIIATQSSLPEKRIARVYNVSDLVAPPANYGFMPGFGMPFGGMMPLGSYGGYGGMGYGGIGGYGTRIGSISTGTGLIVNPYGSRSQELTSLIGTTLSRRR